MPAKTIPFREWEARRMQDPAFRAACEELEPEYQAEAHKIRGPLVAYYTKKINEILREDGITLDDMLRWLDEEREVYYKEHYAKPG